jgi:hypothetical protein
MFKKFIVGFFIFLCGASNAKDVWIPVNDNVLLEDIGNLHPEQMIRGYLLITQSIKFTVPESYTKISQDFAPDDKNRDFKSLQEIENGKLRCPTRQKKGGQVQTVDAPHLARIILFSTGGGSFLFTLDLQKEGLSHDEDCTFWIKTFNAAYAPRTVGEFRATYGNYFDIVMREPYPDMDKDIVVDIEMSKIMSVIQKQNASPEDCKKILPSFYYLETKLDDLPESFYYYFIQVLARADRKYEVRVRAMDYIKKYGKNGKYYTKIINILSDATKN